MATRRRASSSFKTQLLFLKAVGDTVADMKQRESRNRLLRAGLGLALFGLLSVLALAVITSAFADLQGPPRTVAVGPPTRDGRPPSVPAGPVAGLAELSAGRLLSSLAHAPRLAAAEHRDTLVTTLAALTDAGTWHARALLALLLGAVLSLLLLVLLPYSDESWRWGASATRLARLSFVCGLLMGALATRDVPAAVQFLAAGPKAFVYPWVGPASLTGWGSWVILWVSAIGLVVHLRGQEGTRRVALPGFPLAWLSSLALGGAAAVVVLGLLGWALGMVSGVLAVVAKIALVLWVLWALTLNPGQKSAEQSRKEDEDAARKAHDADVIRQREAESNLAAYQRGERNDWK